MCLWLHWKSVISQALSEVQLVNHYTSKMDSSAKIVNSFKSLTTSSKSSILDVWQGSNFISDFSQILIKNVKKALLKNKTATIKKSFPKVAALQFCTKSLKIQGVSQYIGPTFSLITLPILKLFSSCFRHN